MHQTQVRFDHGSDRRHRSCQGAEPGGERLANPRKSRVEHPSDRHRQRAREDRARRRNWPVLRDRGRGRDRRANRRRIARPHRQPLWTRHDRRPTITFNTAPRSAARPGFDVQERRVHRADDRLAQPHRRVRHDPCRHRKGRRRDAHRRSLLHHGPCAHRARLPDRRHM